MSRGDRLDTFPAQFAAGLPDLLGEPDAEPGPCELCGHVGPRRRWKPRSTWTALSTHAYPGEGAICLGCDLLLNGRCPDLGPSGKPMKWVFLTLATDGERSMWATKADKARIAEWVADPAISVSVADGGKKQVAYMAPVADADGQTIRVGFDGVDVSVTLRAWRELTEQVAYAYNAGVSKDRLLHGLSVTDLERLGERSQEITAALRAVAHTPQLALAVWLAQRQEKEPPQMALAVNGNDTEVTG